MRCQLSVGARKPPLALAPSPAHSVITKTEWKKNGNETAQTDMSCAVGAGETAGCFPQDDGSVHSVAVATYRCSSGACAGFAPGLVGKGEESA